MGGWFGRVGPGFPGLSRAVTDWTAPGTGICWARTSPRVHGLGDGSPAQDRRRGWTIEAVVGLVVGSMLRYTVKCRDKDVNDAAKTRASEGVRRERRDSLA